MTPPASRLIVIALLAAFPPALIASCGEGEESSRQGDVTDARDRTMETPETTPPAQGASGPAETIGQTPSEATSIVTAAGLQWIVPASWEASLPENRMRAAELSLPAPEGVAKDDANLIVYYFGESGAGSVEDNLDRWGRQMRDADDQPVVPEINAFDRGGLRITTADLSGTFMSGMPGQSSTPLPKHTLLGAIIENGPLGPVYLKLTGPTEVIEAHRESWRSMLESTRPAS